MRNLMVIKIAAGKADSLGIIAGSLCFVHCLITPFLFVAKMCSVSCCASAPTWWKSLDFIFLVVSFFAIYRSTINTTKNIIKSAFWLSWLSLCFVLINEHLQWFFVSRYAIFLPAFALIFLHIYNIKYCQCKEEACCV